MKDVRYKCNYQQLFNINKQRYTKKYLDITYEIPRNEINILISKKIKNLNEYGIKRYGEYRITMLNKLNELGPNYKSLIVDVGLCFRLEKFIEFSKSMPKYSPWKMREEFSKHLGNIKLYRGRFVTSETLRKTKK